MSKYFNTKKHRPRWKKIKEGCANAVAVSIECCNYSWETPACWLSVLYEDIYYKFDYFSTQIDVKSAENCLWIAPWADPGYGDSGSTIQGVGLEYLTSGKALKEAAGEDNNDLFDMVKRAPKWEAIGNQYTWATFCHVRDDGTISISQKNKEYSLISKDIGTLANYHGTGFTWRAPWLRLVNALSQYAEDLSKLATTSELVKTIATDESIEHVKRMHGWAEACLNEAMKGGKK